MKAALITEEQIKKVEAALEIMCKTDTGWLDGIDALAIVKSLEVQEPVAFRKMAHGMWFYIENKPSPPNDDYEPLYTAPPSKPWVSLTDEEKAEIFQAD